jgi:hypothetical protein
MKRHYYSSKVPQFIFLFLISFTLITFHSCKSNKKEVVEEEIEEPIDNSIEIITEVMDFQMVDTISSGWNTFRYYNKSKETHFFLLDKYPEGKYLKDAEEEVGPIFQNGMDLINEGKTEEGFAEFGKLPEWFSKIVFVGGSGLVSPGHSSETTVKLEPGYYIVECYVKMANGVFHSSMGMVKELIVKDENSNNSPPNPTVSVNISSENGIVNKEVLSKGKQIFAVRFEDQTVHENFVGHDVNLVKLEDNANIDDLEKWMNWADPKGLITPSPEGVIFLGGVNDMPSGSKGYFKVNLDPGNYALISEVPNSSEKNMLKLFEVLDE